MCYSCDQNAKLQQEQARIQMRAHAINHSKIATQINSIQIPSTLGINQQLAAQAYQARVQAELQKKAGIRSSVKRFR